MALQTDTTALLASLWHKNQPLMRERLRTLEQAARAADSGTLDPDLREEAISISHKLAGSLGMFGFPRGTDIARELESAFEQPIPPVISAKVSDLRQAIFPQE